MNIVEAKLEAIRHERKLEKYVKRYSPFTYAVEVSRVLQKARTDGKPKYPIFWMLSSIEACCAYTRGHRSDQVNVHNINAVSNLFNDSNSPYESFLLNTRGSINMFMLVMARRQLEIQVDTNDLRMTLGRAQLLLGQTGVMTKSSEIMEKRYGISLDQWMAYCAGGYFIAGESNGKLNLQHYSEHLPHKFTPESYRGFVDLSSREVGVIANQYRNERMELKSPQLAVCIRSGFLDKPLINFGQDRLLAPQPELLIRHMISGVEQAFRTDDREVWAEEFGKSFENYISAMVSITYGQPVSKPDLSKREEGQKRCDLLIELDDCILLIECKATRFTMNLILEETLYRDNSSERIREAYRQLTETADSLDSSPTDQGVKPIVPLIVMLGEIFDVNSDWYWDTAIRPELDNSKRFCCRPQVLSIAAFEILMQVIRTTNVSVLKVVIDQVKAAENFQHGDWLRAMPDLLPEGTSTRLTEHDSAWEQFMKRLKKQ